MDSAIHKEEKLLIKQARNDPEAFGVLYDRYHPHIFRFILSRTGNYELAQDLTAETFFAALKGIWRFRLLNRPFSAWLYKIAIAQISNFYRKKSNYCELSLDEAPDIINVQKKDFPSFVSTENQDEKIFQFQIVHKLLKKLKSIEHDIIALRYFDDKTFEEIGTILKMKLNTVKSHHRRALLKLRKLIINQEENGRVAETQGFIEASKT